MILTRRLALTLPLAALAAPALVRPARAACQRADLDHGIVFRREDGTQGLARRENADEVLIDYATNRGAWLDLRLVKNGVFEIGRIVQESEEPVVGSTAPSYTWTYSRKPITPEDGATWMGEVQEDVEVIVSGQAETIQRQQARWTASYRCFEPREVTLSGCIYQTLTVEAEFIGNAGTRSQRWVYFPELGLGVETRRDGMSNGLVALGQA